MAYKAKTDKKKTGSKGKGDFKFRLQTPIDLNVWDFEPKWENEEDTLELGMLTRDGFQSYGVKLFRNAIEALGDGETNFILEIANAQNPQTEEWGIQLILVPAKEELPF